MYTLPSKRSPSPDKAGTPLVVAAGPAAFIAPPREASRRPRERKRWPLVVAAGFAVFMAQLDTTIVFVALPTIEREFGVTGAASAWVALGYLAPLIAFTLMSGRVVDAAGPRRALIAGTGGFAAASLAAGLAPTLPLLIAARAVQGAAAALLLAGAPVVALHAARRGATGRALGVVATIASLGAVAGPPLGGQLVELAGWPAIFFVNVPIAITVAAIGWRHLRATRAPVALKASSLTEAALLGTAAIALLLALSRAPGDGAEWLLTLVGVPPLLAAWSRSRISRPVRRVVRGPALIGAHVALAAVYSALMVVQFLVPFYLHRTLGLSPAATGLTLLALPAAAAVVGLLSGALADRYGAPATAAAGAAVLIAALLSIFPLDAGWAPSDLVWRLAAAGMGFGLFHTAAQTLVMTRAPRKLLGTATASSNLARQLGIALGPALGAAAWAASGYALDGMRAGLALAVVLGGIALVAVARTRASELALESFRERRPSCP